VTDYFDRFDSFDKSNMLIQNLQQVSNTLVRGRVHCMGLNHVIFQAQMNQFNIHMHDVHRAFV